MASLENEIFLHPRLILVSHFDAIINKLDIRTETLIEETKQQQQLTLTPSDAQKNKQRIEDLNELRERQIEKIKEIEKINFRSLKENKNLGLLLMRKDFNYELECERIKESIIFVDCVWLDKKEALNGLHLWITNGYNNQSSLEVLR